MQSPEPEELDSGLDFYSSTTGVKDPVHHQAVRIFSSAVLFSLAYILTFLLFQTVTWLLCLVFGYEPLLRYNELEGLPGHYKFWSVPRVVLIFSSGQLVCLIAGIFFKEIYEKLSGYGSLFRFLLLWLGICNINLFLSFLFFSPLGILKTSSGLFIGFALVGAWTGFGNILMIPLAILSAIISFFVGSAFYPLFLKFSFSRKLQITIKGRKKIIVQFFLLPILLAAPFLLSLSTPRSLPVHGFVLINFLIMCSGMYFKTENYEGLYKIFPNDVLKTFPLFWIILLGIIYVLIFTFLK